MRELKMFQITVNISLMLLPKEGSEVGKPPGLYSSVCKRLHLHVRTSWGPDLTTNRRCHMHSKLDTHHSKGFLPVLWANLCTAMPLGVDQWRWNVPFQRLVQREKHFLSPTLVLLAGFLLSFRTKSFTFSFSHLVLHSSKTFILASWLELKC